MAQEQEKYYSIKVGFVRPDEVEYGHVDKEGKPKGPTKKGFAQVGTYGIPNISRVWGKPEKTKEGKRTGKIEFLKWGTPGGEVCPIRYLTSSSSIDKKYQDENGIEAGPTDIELVFQTGVNKISRTDNPSLVLMLENHTLNQDSTSRAPDTEDFHFCNYSAAKELELKNKERSDKVQAQQFILDASKEEGGIEVLARIFNEDLQIESAELQDKLWDKADINAEGFLKYINDYKDLVEARVLEADALGVVSLSESGKIQLIEGGIKSNSLIVDPKFDAARKIQYLKDSAVTIAGNQFLTLMENGVNAAKQNITA